MFIKTILLLSITITLFPLKINEKVLICGLTKNNGKTLSKTLKAVVNIASLFQDHRILILENNSTDNTKEILQDFQQTSNKRVVFSKDYTEQELYSFSKARQWDSRPSRMCMLATFRNMLLDEILLEKYKGFDYAIIIDLDLEIHRSIVKPIIDTFAIRDSWDAVFANGVFTTLEYYDRFALRDDAHPIGPELDPQWWENLYTAQFDGNNLIKVHSAFGGLGIYKKEALRGCRYSGIVNNSVEKFTKHLLSKDSIRRNPAVIRYFNTIDRFKLEGSLCHYSQDDQNNIAQVTKDCNAASPSSEVDALFFLVNCCGHIYYPIICEHVPLHYEMIMNGFSRLYINPKLYVFYL